MIAGSGGEREELAPVIPLFGGAAPTPRRQAGEGPWHASWIEDVSASAAPDVGDGTGDTGIGGSGSGWAGEGASTRGRHADNDETEREVAERTLLRRLRGRSLSIAEARAVLREREIEPDASEALLERFQSLGYLDDGALAEQLIHAGSERRGQGRRVIAQTMAKRGIPRDVADAALAALPDDDEERALEFARSKARSMTSLDRDTALRRLTGQLARRGYGGSVAMSAARAALDEQARGTGRSGVHFR